MSKATVTNKTGQRFSLRKNAATENFNGNKVVKDADEVITRWELELSKTNLFNGDQKSLAEKSSTTSLCSKEINDALKPKKAGDRNPVTMKTSIKNLKTQTIEKINKINNNQNASRTNVDKVAEELESIKTELELSKNKLKFVEEELSNEKSKNITMMNSYVTTLERCKNLEADVLAGKEQLENKNKELENVFAEKNNILKQLETSKIDAITSEEKFNILKDEWDIEVAHLHEKLRELEDERSGWNEYQISLENRISEDQKSLARKEQYIQNQDFMIEKLTHEKQDLQIKLLDGAEERQVEQLSAIIEEMKSKFNTVVTTYNGEIAALRNTITEQSKTITDKSELIKRHEEMAYEATMKTNAAENEKLYLSKNSGHAKRRVKRNHDNNEGDFFVM